MRSSRRLLVTHDGSNRCKGWLIGSGFVGLLTLGLADLILIMQVYTLWDHRPRVLQALFGAFTISFATLIAFGISSLIKMLGAIVYDSETFHMCLIKSKPATWVGIWASQVTFVSCSLHATFHKTNRSPLISASSSSRFSTQRPGPA
ncbi:hypothetical protein DENSPDRAFT_61927 [Dentipellis sp. KUC8613]|nr:hypothetical protein DENSPDRAFT_61927 [Dentipellis sp. KUC8613]